MIKRSRSFKKLNKKLTKLSKRLRKLNKKLRKTSKLSVSRIGLMAGTALVAIGLILGGYTLLNTWLTQHTASKLSSQALKSNDQAHDDIPLISGTPVRIEVPSVSIDLKVIPGYYYPKSQSWTLSLNDAQYGVMTAPANNRGGDTFIYAHYRKGVFLALPKIQTGATAVVTTDNGHSFTYTFRASQITTPQDTSLFTYKGKPILVLQTCTGVWFQNRQLFTFDLVKAV